MSGAVRLRWCDWCAKRARPGSRFCAEHGVRRFVCRACSKTVVQKRGAGRPREVCNARCAAAWRKVREAREVCGDCRYPGHERCGRGAA